MKYRKRSRILSLLAGLTVLTNSCTTEKTPQLELLTSKTLTGFPSASAIEYDGKGRLYLFGDDAPYLLVMDTSYRQLDTVRYSIDTAFRIDKSVKADIESATLVNYDGDTHLYAMGSLSAPGRRNLFYFSLDDPHTYLSIDFTPFIEKTKAVAELNIEGMAVVQSKFVLANRANYTHRVNQLLIAGNDLNDYKNMPPPHVIDLEFDSAKVIGVSGLYYVEEKDLLLFTASEEETLNAISDGVINDSYLGWISHFSKRMSEKKLKPEQLIRLGSVNKVFEKQKIESVCLQELKDDVMTLQLVSDNDNGQSGLFKVRLKL